MIVALDNTILTLVFNSAARATPNPSTGEPAADIDLRIKSMIEQHAIPLDETLLLLLHVFFCSNVSDE